jgi:hypothetical protein
VFGEGDPYRMIILYGCNWIRAITLAGRPAAFPEWYYTNTQCVKSGIQSTRAKYGLAVNGNRLWHRPQVTSAG